MNTIGITMGDPRGIGPEIIAKAWRRLGEDERAGLKIYGDIAVLSSAAKFGEVEFSPEQMVMTSSLSLPIDNITDVEAARAGLAAIDAAVQDIDSKKICAVVTAPVNKKRMRSIEPGFTGHTGYLARAAGVKDAVMMFCGERSASWLAPRQPAAMACISLVTQHLPIKDVAGQITKERVLVTIRRMSEALRAYFSCPDAEIAVMSLNPHAGEGGLLGKEERKSIAPAIDLAQKEGINCKGPIAADSLFRNLEGFDYDGVVAMYHDQGLLPIKTLCGNSCVNVTLGLPYIRTSTGYGTAEDIAWLGRADEENMLATIRLTRRMLDSKVKA